MKIKKSGNIEANSNTFLDIPEFFVLPDPENPADTDASQGLRWARALLSWSAPWSQPFQAELLGPLPVLEEEESLDEPFDSAFGADSAFFSLPAWLFPL
jgi:hypothetical protein